MSRERSLPHGVTELRWFPQRRFLDAANAAASARTRELAVVFTIRDKLLRVISARPMSRRERREYAHAKSQEA